MQIFNNIKVSKKIYLLAIVMQIFLAITAGLGIWASNSINSKMDTLYYTELKSMEYAKNIDIELGIALSDVLFLAMPGVSKATMDDYKARFEHRMDLSYQNLAKSQELAKSPENIAKLQDIPNAWTVLKVK